jgi:hypothetical protein
MRTKILPMLALMLLLPFLSCLPAKQNLAPTPSASTPAPPAIPVRFTDVTEDAGIDFLHQSAKTPRKYLVETFGSGCAFLDFDNDGWQDILLLNNAPIPGGKVQGIPKMKLYRNLGKGKFADVTQKAGLSGYVLYAMGAAVGDYDNDGFEDIYISCALSPGMLLRNDGKGRFQDVTKQAGVGNAGRWGTSCAWLDYNRDGHLDLFVCNYVKYASLADDQPCTAGEKNIYCIPSAYQTSACTLFRNEGNGRFKDVSAQTGIAAGKSKALGVAIWDFDNDGWPDIFVANDTVAGFLFHNDGKGKFREIGTESGVAFDDEGNPHSGMGIDADDLNNDGQFTLTITNFQGQQTSFYRPVSLNASIFRDDRLPTQIGSGTENVLGFGIFFFDFDNDGYKDVFQVNGHVQDDIQEREPNVTYKQPTLLFRNRQDGVFEEVGLKSGTPFSRPIVGRGCAWGDFDNDGRQDVAIIDNDGKAMLWRNETPTENHWLKLRLIGTKSNRSGIGALVRVEAGGITRRTLVRSGSSYLSQSDLRPNFGLGKERAATVEIRWPSGQVDRFENVACDRLWIAREGATALQ